MKKFLLPTLLLLLFSCSHKDNEVLQPNETHTYFNSKEIEVDTMERAMFSTYKRPHINDTRITWIKPVIRDTLTGTTNFVVLLVFDGEDVSGTNWNVDGSIIHAAPSGFTEAEKEDVKQRMVRMFQYKGIYITRDRSLWMNADPHRRMRVIFTESYEWYGVVGGVSFFNSFTWGDDNPCWVFSSLLRYDTKCNAIAGAHELGHTLGLRHQALWIVQNGVWVKTTDYNPGTQAKAPIMGDAYNSDIAEWWIGPTPYAPKPDQYDGRNIEQKTEGKYDGYGNWLPWGTYVGSY